MLSSTSISVPWGGQRNCRGGLCLARYASHAVDARGDLAKLGYRVRIFPRSLLCSRRRSGWRLGSWRRLGRRVASAPQEAPRLHRVEYVILVLALAHVASLVPPRVPSPNRGRLERSLARPLKSLHDALADDHPHK